MTQLNLFSSGIEHASFVTSYQILKKTWNVITSSSNDSSNDGVGVGVGLCWKVFKEQNSDLTIIAFEATTKDSSSNLKTDLVSSSDSKVNDFPQFDFLCSEKNPSFSLNKTLVSLFCDNLQKLDQLKSQISTKNPLIITGKGVGGSIASIFTISLLDNFGSSKIRPLCITFGSPLIGDKNLQQTISRSSKWNSCFLNIVSYKDPLPTLFITKNHVPFGTFLFCSDSDSTCFDNPDSNYEIILSLSKIHVHDQGFQSNKYGDIVENLRRKSVFKDSSIPAGDRTHSDSLGIGISLQLQALGLTSQIVKEHNIDINDLEKNINKLESMYKKKKSFDPSKKLNEMKKYMAQLEWYKKDTKGHNIGYYDSYKNMNSPFDHDVVGFHKKLTKYWEDMVTEVEMKPQKEGAAFRTRWLLAGTSYRRMVEPLVIADYYKEGGKDYVNEKRSKHFKSLEKWFKEDVATKAKNELNSNNRKNVKDILTIDSCFWARVEEAILDCKDLKVVEDKEEIRKKLVEFEDYVYGLLKDYAVSPEIFLRRSSFMSWWMDYKAIKGSSYTSKLAKFMNDATKIKEYGLGTYDFREL